MDHRYESQPPNRSVGPFVVLLVAAAIATMIAVLSMVSADPMADAVVLTSAATR